MQPPPPEQADADALSKLEAEERAFSRHRAIVHGRIEFVAAGGAAEPDQLRALMAEERELSEKRQQLHDVINNVREALGLPPYEPTLRPEREPFI